jgi:hypothetical protein
MERNLDILSLMYLLKSLVQVEVDSGWYDLLSGIMMERCDVLCVMAQFPHK